MAAPQAVPVQHITLQGNDPATGPFNKAIRIVSLLDRRPNAPSLPVRWLLQTDLEDLLYPSVITQGTTGAFYRLLHRSGIASGVTLPLRRNSIDAGLINAAEFADLKALFHVQVRVFTLVPVSSVGQALATYGCTAASEALLNALGLPRPQEWPEAEGEESDEESESHEDGEEDEEEDDGHESFHGADDSNDESDGNGASGSGEGGSDDDGDHEGSDESRSRSHHSNSATADGPTEEAPVPVGTSSSVKITRKAKASRRPHVSKTLEQQFSAFERHRCALINRQRSGKAVASVTAADDRRSILHFFSWLQHVKGVKAPSFRHLAHPQLGAIVQEFVEEKSLTCKHARIAKLVGSLINASRFTLAHLAAKSPPGVTVSQKPLEELMAIHSQALAESRQETKFGAASPPKAWLDWAACQKARAMAQGILANCDESDSDDKRLELTGDVCLLKVLTGLPPDRPGVYRLLKLGDTLASTEGGGYQLDLSKPGQHKTASVFGPACTTTPPSVAAAINALVAVDNLHDGEYLFHGGQKTVPLSPKQWCLRVKETFKTFGGVALCPKDVRASFVTWLRSGHHGDSVLTQAARQMRHSSSMQASVHYDKARSERVVSAASRVAEAFANQFK